MTRQYKIRRGSFKQGQIQRHKDFNRFRREYQDRRKRELRLKVLLALAILTMVLAIIVGVAASPAGTPQPAEHPEVHFEETNQKL